MCVVCLLVSAAVGARSRDWLDVICCGLCFDVGACGACLFFGFVDLVVCGCV